jgi:hypothetical protein
MADAHHVLGTGRSSVQVIYPRLLGALALAYAAILQRGALDWSSDGTWLAFTGTWLAVSVFLVSARLVAPASAVLALLCLLLWLGPGRHLHDATPLLMWLALSVALTEHRPAERALLVRITVTTVYAFAAVAKLNPSFLAGEQIAAMAADRSQLEWLVPVASGVWGPMIAWATIAAEGGLAIALWLPRTRRPAALIGGLMHVTFILAAHQGTLWDVAHVATLNLGLVAGYLAFFEPAAWREPGLAATP